jgi:hypothetical protein
METFLSGHPATALPRSSSSAQEAAPAAPGLSERPDRSLRCHPWASRFTD